MAADARFCSSCGATVRTGPGLGRNERLLWFGGGGLVVALVGAVALAVTRGSGGTVPPAAAAEAPLAGGGSGAAPPDISNLSPRERFDKLFDRIMRAAEANDGNTVTSFAPMALGAYQMLDSVDADARYHAALIMLHTGDVAGAKALADTIVKTQPGHLFGYVIRGTIARFEKDTRTLNQSYRDFLAHYEAETKAKRPEYEAHPRAIAEFLTAAREAKNKS